MNINEELYGLLELASEKSQAIPVIKRALKKAGKGFRPKSPNDVDHITFLAVALHTTGDEGLGIKLLEYLDCHTEVNDWPDLAGSLASSRLFLVNFYYGCGKVELALDLLQNKDISESMNLEDEVNPVTEELNHSIESMEFNEKDDESRHSDMIEFSYGGYWSAVVLAGRIQEIEGRIESKDKVFLYETLELFKSKFHHYLVVVPDHASFKKARSGA